MPTTVYKKEELDAGKDLITLLVETGLAKNRSEARRLITQGGIQVSQKRVESIDFTVTRNMLMDGIIIQKGKKVFRKAGQSVWRVRRLSWHHSMPWYRFFGRMEAFSEN